MIDTIFFVISQAVLLFVLSYFYIVITTRWLPAKWLRPVFPKNKHDRGIKKNIFENGRSVTYEPALAFRKYMSGYVLFCEGEKKYIKCKIATDIREIKYSVAVFDRHNSIIGTLDISEKTQGQGYTQSVCLPDETAFVQMTVLSADGEYPKANTARYYSYKGIIFYAATTVIYTVIMAMFYIMPIHDLLKLIIREYFYYTDDLPNLVTALFFGFCFGILNTGIMLVLNLSGNAKIIKPEERYYEQ